MKLSGNPYCRKWPCTQMVTPYWFSADPYFFLFFLLRPGFKWSFLAVVVCLCEHGCMCESVAAAAAVVEMLVLVSVVGWCQLSTCPAAAQGEIALLTVQAAADPAGSGYNKLLMPQPEGSGSSSSSSTRWRGMWWLQSWGFDATRGWESSTLSCLTD